MRFQAKPYPHHSFIWAFFVSLIFVLNAPSSLAQDDQKKSDKEKKETKEQKKKTIKEIIKNSERIDGLLTLFRDKKSGELRLLLKPKQLNKNYLYFTYVENGVHAAGFSLTRGAYNVQQAKLIRLSRYFDKIEWTQQNTGFYYDPDKAISRAADANISPAIIFSQKIEAENNKTGEVLIQVDSLFLSESLIPIRPLPDPEGKPHESFSLGKLSAAKSKIARIRNYPENTDLRVEYVYENETPHQDGGPAVTDPRYVSIVAQHSLLKLPDKPMTPRFDDPRVGYFGHQITDLSSSELTPYRDVISRFRLEKKHPAADLSEPVKPITFWLENTTPLALRPIITQAALRWNDAFEKAGFKNALVIKIQPDDASWDAGDIRYNVIRWVSSPSRFYSGYGPSFHDPRSGEVLGADIMLEYASLSRGARLAELINNTLADNVHAPPHRAEGCQASAHAAQQYQFGLNALKAFGAGDKQQQRLLEEFVYFLTLHEIGHTLGLNHNFRSNYLHGFEEIFTPDITYPVGLQGSIMDYPAVPLQPDNALQNQFYSTRPGPYDEWAIEFGYHPPLADPNAEQQRLAALLSRSAEPALAFANDADDMRYPGKGIDPRSMVYAQSSDPIRFAQHQIGQLRSVQPKLRQKMQGEKDLYHSLLNSHHLSLALFRNHLNVISRYIGGVYVERSAPGEPGAAATPFLAVDVADQRRAMQVLNDEIFAPSAFENFDINAAYLLERRRGFNHFGYTIDPKLHQSAADIQNQILDQLLHPMVVARLIDSAKYGNQYSVAEFFVSLTDAVFKADLKTAVNSYRQNLQLDYTRRLIRIVRDGAYPNIVQSLALDRLRWIKKSMQRHAKRDLSVRAHREHIIYRIDKALEI